MTRWRAFWRLWTGMLVGALALRVAYDVAVR